MVRSLTAFLGILTVLSVVGAMTVPGQALFGLRSPQSMPSVTVIQDPPAVTGPVLRVVAHPAVPAPASFAASSRAAGTLASRPRAASAPSVPPRRPVPSVPSDRPRPAPVAPAPTQPAPAASVPAQGGLDQVVKIANILLNLPQVLSQTQAHPVPRPGPWSEQP